MKFEANTCGSWLQASGSLPLKDMPPSSLHTMVGINDVAVAGSYGYVYMHCDHLSRKQCCTLSNGFKQVLHQASTSMSDR